MPHPVYARQNWVCILNPSEESFDRVVKPLLTEAHDLGWRGPEGRRRIGQSWAVGGRSWVKPARRS